MPPVINPNASELIVKYTSMGKLHRCSFNFGENLTGDEVAQFMSAFTATHIGLMRQADAIQGVEQKQIGSAFTVPYPFTPVTGAVANNQIWAEDADSVFCSIVGRSLSSGQRVRHMFFTPANIGQWPDDNRFRSGEYQPATDIITSWQEFLNGQIEETPYPAPTSDDGTDATWYPYLNYARSAYWQRKQRT